MLSLVAVRVLARRVDDRLDGSGPPARRCPRGHRVAAPRSHPGSALRRVGDRGASDELAGAAAATVGAALAGAIASFAIGFTRFGLTLPVGHLARIALATVAMAGLLKLFPEAPNFMHLAAHVGAGVAAYLAAIALLYAPSLFRMFRPRPQQAA